MRSTGTHLVRCFSWCLPRLFHVTCCKLRFIACFRPSFFSATTVVCFSSHVVRIGSGGRSSVHTTAAYIRNTACGTVQSERCDHSVVLTVAQVLVGEKNKDSNCRRVGRLLQTILDIRAKTICRPLCSFYHWAVPLTEGAHKIGLKDNSEQRNWEQRMKVLH